jgi:hypothetical protein
MYRVVVAGVLVGCVSVGVAIFGRPHVGNAAPATALCNSNVKNRWDVKTLADLRASNPPKIKRNAELRSIDYLVTQEHAPIGERTARLPGVERTKYVLKDVTPVEAIIEGDGDRHLVIRDDHGQPTDQMIVEFPDLTCDVHPPAKYRPLIKQARKEFETFIEQCKVAPLQNGWRQFRPTSRATIRGFGYFDLLHGTTQHGVAGNEIELHPAIGFHGSC